MGAPCRQLIRVSSIKDSREQQTFETPNSIPALFVMGISASFEVVIKKPSPNELTKIHIGHNQDTQELSLSIVSCSPISMKNFNLRPANRRV